MADTNDLVGKLTKELVSQLGVDLKERQGEYPELVDVPFAQLALVTAIATIGLLYQSIVEENNHDDNLDVDVTKLLLTVHQDAVHKSIDVIFNQPIGNKATDQE